MKLNKAFQLLIKTFLILLLTTCSLSLKNNNDETKKNKTSFGIEFGFLENQDGITFFNNTQKELKLDFIHDSIEMSMLDENPDSFIEKLEIYNYVFSPKTELFLTITNPINTTIKNVPKKYENMDFDDEIFINDFKKYLDLVFSKIPDTKLTGIVIGNEIDLYLIKNENEIESFKYFFIEIKKYIKQIRPDAKVSFCSTLEGATLDLKEKLIDLNKYSDFVCLTYYPENGSMHTNPEIIKSDFKKIYDIYTKDIYFQECGYPSSENINCSEDQQEQFIIQLFEAWDLYDHKIKIISYYELIDLPDDYANEYMKNLNFTDKNIFYFLTSLGIMKSNGEKKKAYNTLIKIRNSK